MSNRDPDVLAVGDRERLDAARAEYFQQRLDELKKQRPHGGEKFVIAALGSLTWVGSLIAVAAQLKATPAESVDIIHRLWLEQHEAKLERLRSALLEMVERFNGLGDEVQERIESEEYLQLVRKGFRVWDESDTEEKRRYVVNLLTNAGGGPRLANDDMVRQFIEWVATYHESHFSVVREVYRHPHVTRLAIWRNVWGSVPIDSSAEADLFRLLIRDLSTGGMIRQAREVNAQDQFVRERQRPRRRGAAPAVLESSFDDEDEYVLTELGKQFVHYTMNEVVRRLDQPQE